VVSWAERRLDLFGITAEGTLVHRSMVDGVWMTDEDLGRPGPSIPSAPAVVSAAAERLSVFVRSDLNLFQRSWTIAGWDAWLDLGGDFSGKPATAARFPATIDLVGAAITGGEVWGKTSQLGAWTPYFDPIHGIAAPGTGPALTSLGGSDVLNMEIADQRGMLWHGRFDYRGWTSFEPVGGQPQGSPAAVQLQTGEGHTLIVMIDQGRPGIWHRIWN
jgi:hypothetical protein